MTSERNGHNSSSASVRQRTGVPGGSTSRSLLASAQLEDPAAWERLVKLYAPLVASWCRRWSVAEQDIVDLLQEVFTAVARNLDRFRKEKPADTFRGWLLTITRNKVRDHFRRRAHEPTAAGGSEATRRMQQLLDAAPEIDDGEAGTETGISSAFSSVLRHALETIRGEFHERTWRAFWGVVIDGRQTADVAAELDMKPGTVRVSKSRVLMRLRHELGDGPVEVSGRSG